jgi:2-polyprenyl-6-methoxyphenol hydroxylase-like FAD-dependent oxidoreductase
MRKTERTQTVIIGAGQAGLAAAYYLKQRSLPFVLLEAHPRVGDAWRNRWDSLHLFTPARYDSIAGLPFPAPPRSFPSMTRWRTPRSLCAALQLFSTGCASKSRAPRTLIGARRLRPRTIVATPAFRSASRRVRTELDCRSCNCTRVST